MKHSIIAVLALVATSFMVPSISLAQSFGSAFGSGFSDGLVTDGRGGVSTWGSSVAISRADTSPEYGAGIGADSRGVMVGSVGRNAASGDFFQESAAGAEADIMGDRGSEQASAFADGQGAYAAQSSGSNRVSMGGTIGTADTRAIAIDQPGQRGDFSGAEAQQTTASGAMSASSDRRAAASASMASASSRAEAND